ncbi:hypothetical protein ACFTAO_45480 [Paenibacillus rhizoplanae]
MSDRGDLGINRKLGQPIPADARLYIVADEATYRRIKRKLDHAVGFHKAIHNRAVPVVMTRNQLFFSG